MIASASVQIKNAWAIKILRRLVALPPGRYLITLTIGERPEDYDWSVMQVGRVEG